MKTLKQRITRPLIWSAVLVPVAILLVFNLGMRQMMIRSAQTELLDMTVIVRSLLRQATDEPSDADAVNQPARQRLESARAVLRATSQATGTDLLVLSRDGRILFPADPGELALNSRIMARLKASVLTEYAEGKVLQLRTITGQYLFVATALRPLQPERSPLIVCLTRYSPTRGLLLFANLILVGILALGSGAAIAVALQTARRINEPLQHLRRFAGQVGQGQFGTIQIEPYCQEVADLQRQLNEMSRQLSRADQLQQTFLQQASHELRTPLMAIQGYAEGLEQGVLSDVTGAAAIIGQESRRLNRLVEELLTLSRIDNKVGSETLTDLNVPDWLRDQIQRLQMVAAKDQKQIHLQTESEQIRLSVNEHLLGQAINNILVNAIRYAKQQVRVSVTTRNNQAIMTIEDDGSGIDPADLPHIFERFYKGRLGQYGLGLAITQAAVQAMHGTVVASNSLAGARFEVCLPL